MIRFDDWRIEAPAGLFAHQHDHLSRRIEVLGDLPQGWEWSLLVQVGDDMDIIRLSPCDGGVGVDLTRDQLSVGDAFYHLQLRGTNGDKVRHTNVIMMFIPKSLSGTGRWPTVPSEFLQVEQRILDINNHPPVPGENGFWMLWEPDEGAYKESAFPLPEGGGGAGSPGKDGGYYAPAVDEDGNLTWTASKDEMPAVPGANIMGPAGADGRTPHIGANGNWFIGDEDTGVAAKAPAVADVLAALPTWDGGSY